MKFDITKLLQDWEYKPGQVVARRFQSKDGEKIQLRVDLGVLQMNTLGRPDGKMPMGYESWHHLYQRRSKIITSTPFSLGVEECSRLQQEAVQYHHRYICFFQLKDFEAVERDCVRNLEVFEFVGRYAAAPPLAWGLAQFTPQLLMMRTRARSELQLSSRARQASIASIEEGITAIEDFYRNNDRNDLLEFSGELMSLRQRLEELQRQPPEGEFERLQMDLAEAIRAEDYERAAKVRDQLRKLSPES